ncbi:MAG: GNAT family acetyltransferase [Pseudomonadota bacterium]
MGHDTEFRTYQSGDEDGVLALWSDVFPDKTAWNAPKAVISRKRAVQPEFFYVATVERRVVGTIMAGYDGVRGWIHRLAVHPDHRRKGLASQLMHKAEHGLMDIGCPKLNLQVRASNMEVVQFYRALGYMVEERLSLGKPLV